MRGLDKVFSSQVPIYCPGFTFNDDDDDDDDDDDKDDSDDNNGDDDSTDDDDKFLKIEKCGGKW